MNPHTVADDRFPWEDEEPRAEPAGDAASDAAEPMRAAALETIDPAVDVAPSETFEPSALSEETETIGKSIDIADDVAEVAMPVERDVPATSRPVAPREYYSISEVCDLVGLKPHVLRYWETQFQVLNPSKNRSGNRVYQRKEIRLILLVKHLLYEEKYTVDGARAKLDRFRRAGQLQEETTRVLDGQMVELLRAELDALRSLLTPPTTG